MDNKLFDKCLDTILRRDRARKDAELAQADYIREFGDQMIGLFRARAEYTRGQHMVMYCQQMERMGRPVDGAQMDFIVGKHMEDTAKDLKEITAEYEQLSSSEPISAEESAAIEALYKGIAAEFHPDLHPELEEQAEAKDLWTEILFAYGHDQREVLQGLKQAVADFLKAHEIPAKEIPPQGYMMRISQIENEIQQIMNSDTYMFKTLLDDPAQVKAQKENLQAETDRYHRYAEKMKEELAKFEVRR